MPSSPDSSSDSSVGSPHNHCEGPNIEAESCLPGVVSFFNSFFVVVVVVFSFLLCIGSFQGVLVGWLVGLVWFGLFVGLLVCLFYTLKKAEALHCPRPKLVY